MIEFSFLRTRIARRVFALFLLSALIPTVILAGIAYRQVNGQLTAQSVERLRQISKLHGQALHERLVALAVDLEAAAATVSEPGGVDGFDLDSLASLHTRFTTFAVSGIEPSPGAAGTGREEHLRTGRALLDARTGKGQPRIRMGIAIHPEDPGRGVLWGDIDPGYLWGSERERIGTTDTPVCVARGDESLYCEVPIPRGTLESLAGPVTSPGSARFEWRDESANRDYVAARWDAFLMREYLEQNWTVVASMAREEVLAPISRFKTTFLLTLLLSVGVVFVFSSIQIRRSLEPVRKLREGTRRVARREFDVQVQVDSGDEFGELADSFNRMAARLERQFNTLEAMSDIDREILSTLDSSRIAETVLAGGARIAGADSVTVGLISPGRDLARVSTRASGDSCPSVETQVPWNSSLGRQLAAQGRWHWLEGDPGALGSLFDPRDASSGRLLLPLLVEDEIAGWVALGYSTGHRCSEDDRAHARQLADQVAVGLSNVRLVERLDELSWGTIRALARTIDAKSQWTAGHSERVTGHALELARALGLAPTELKLIERGGLLHDIGKIGVPAAILDKPSKLTDEEWEIVKRHPVIGAEILEPVVGLEPVIGMVRHHHERMDGAGYPDGLSGEDIPFLARLLAVADVWDSLRSERPYRPPLPVEVTTEIMLEGRGPHFDPILLDRFLEIAGDTEARREADQLPSESNEATQSMEESHAL